MTEFEDLEKRVAALARGQRHANETIDDLREENEALRDRVAELERVVGPDTEWTDYEHLTRDEKVFRLRAALVEKAVANGGRAKMNYGEVRAVFDFKASVGHAYDLMEAAGAADGFDYDTSHDENRIRVRTAAVNDETLIHAVNNEPSESPA